MKNDIALTRTDVLHDGLMIASFTALACLVPAASHLVALPLSALNPMLLAVAAAMVLLRNRRMAYLLAVAMPLVACLATGMPTPVKALCMVAELTTVVALASLVGRKTRLLPAMLMAIVGGKVVYYALKAALLAPAVLVGTAWQWQLLSVAVALGLVAALNALKSK